MANFQIVIPPTVTIADLQVERDADGMVSFNWTPIATICTASGIELSLLTEGPEDNIADLLITWYSRHLATGGARDPVLDDLFEEALLELTHGDGTSHEPGRA